MIISHSPLTKNLTPETDSTVKSFQYSDAITNNYSPKKDINQYDQ